MKRAIKYYSQYASDGANFSTCSTKYEILPGLYPDSAGYDELCAIAEKNGMVEQGSAEISDRATIKITHSILLLETKKIITNSFRDEYEDRAVYLGFVVLINSNLFPPLVTLNNEPPKRSRGDLLNDLISEGMGYRLGIDAVGYHGQDEKHIIVMSGWHYYHVLPLLGYSLEKLKQECKIEDEFFYDSVSQCSDCGDYDDSEGTYTGNFRYVESYGEFGINCGCFAAFCLNNVESFANDPKNPLELEQAETLQKKRRLKHIERFIGGMVDGRGGYYAGKSCREGVPEKILAQLLKDNPKKQYVFTHDESGQFQTYFSVWELKPKRKTKRTKAVKRSKRTKLKKAS